MKVGKDRRIIFGAVIEISRLSCSHWNQKTNKTFSILSLKILAIPDNGLFIVLDQKMVKYTNLILKDKVMGTFYGRMFYDHLNKKDSKLILVIKSLGCVFTLISYRGTLKSLRKGKRILFNVYVLFQR